MSVNSIKVQGNDLDTFKFLLNIQVSVVLFTFSTSISKTKK